MKTLVIISSFRKKNTYNTVKQIEKVHQEISPSDYEYLFLKDMNLERCIGCHQCLTKGEQYCPLKDDRDLILQKIESSDAVILASPNHTMNVNWQMKNLIDRLSYLMHRPRFFKQRFMILITSGSYMGIKQAQKALSPMASAGKIVSRLGVMASPSMNDSKRSKEAKKVAKSAKHFAQKLNKEHNFKASFMNMMWFSAFNATSQAQADIYPADYEYYQNKAFFTNVKLNTFQAFIIKSMTRFMTVLISKGLV